MDIKREIVNYRSGEYQRPALKVGRSGERWAASINETSIDSTTNKLKYKKETGAREENVKGRKSANPVGQGMRILKGTCPSTLTERLRNMNADISG